MSLFGKPPHAKPPHPPPSQQLCCRVQQIRSHHENLTRHISMIVVTSIMSRIIIICICVHITPFARLYIMFGWATGLGYGMGHRNGPQGYRMGHRKEPVRFDSFRFRTFQIFIGSVWFGSQNFISRFEAVRPACFGRVVAPSDSVRFGSASGSGRFRNYTVRFGSVRPVRFGFLLLPEVGKQPCVYYTILCYTMPYYNIALIMYISMTCYTILYYTILYCIIIYYTMQYYTLLYYTMIYYTILYTYIHYIYMCIYIYMYIYIHIHIHTCEYIYIYICIYIYIYIYILY